MRIRESMASVRTRTKMGDEYDAELVQEMQATQIKTCRTESGLRSVDSQIQCFRER